jgi:hypothetical protein
MEKHKGKIRRNLLNKAAKIYAASLVKNLDDSLGEIDDLSEKEHEYFLNKIYEIGNKISEETVSTASAAVVLAKDNIRKDSKTFVDNLIG